MSEKVRRYYDELAEGEWERLIDPYARIEFESTIFLIEKYFPNRGTVLDIGAGPGRYSLELLKRGYQVTLWELSAEQVRLAREKIEGAGKKACDYICDDARNIDRLDSESFNAVLLMGPMYHIQKGKERIELLKKVKNLLTDNGIMIIAYLNSWGILKAGITEFYETYAREENIYNLLRDSSYDEGFSFTDVYFSTPPKALEEVKNAGLEIESYAGAEGFLSGISTEIKRLYSEEKDIYENLLKAAAETCEAPQYREATEHLHIVARKGR